MQDLERQIGELLRPEPLGLLFGGLDLEPVALVDRRAHDERLPPGLHLPPDDVVGGRPFELRADHRGLDRLAAGGELVEDGHVEVAVVGQRERPRDGCRGHYQNVRRRPFALERHALMDAEPVLLVDHGEREIAERDTLLHERVRPDDEVDLARGDPLQDALPLLPGHGGGEEGERQAVGPALTDPVEGFGGSLHVRVGGFGRRFHSLEQRALRRTRRADVFE